MMEKPTFQSLKEILDVLSLSLVVLRGFCNNILQCQLVGIFIMQKISQMCIKPEVHLHQVWKKSTAYCKALAVINEVCQNSILWCAWVTAAQKGLKRVTELPFSWDLWIHCISNTDGMCAFV